MNSFFSKLLGRPTEEEARRAEAASRRAAQEQRVLAAFFDQTRCGAQLLVPWRRAVSSSRPGGADRAGGSRASSVAGPTPSSSSSASLALAGPAAAEGAAIPAAPSGEGGEVDVDDDAAAALERAVISVFRDEETRNELPRTIIAELAARLARTARQLTTTAATAAGEMHEGQHDGQHSAASVSAGSFATALVALPHHRARFHFLLTSLAALRAMCAIRTNCTVLFEVRGADALAAALGVLNAALENCVSALGDPASPLRGSGGKDESRNSGGPSHHQLSAEDSATATAPHGDPCDPVAVLKAITVALAIARLRLNDTSFAAADATHSAAAIAEVFARGSPLGHAAVQSLALINKFAGMATATVALAAAAAVAAVAPPTPSPTEARREGGGKVAALRDGAGEAAAAGTNTRPRNAALIDVVPQLITDPISLSSEILAVCFSRDALGFAQSPLLISTIIGLLSRFCNDWSSPDDVFTAAHRELLISATAATHLTTKLLQFYPHETLRQMRQTGFSEILADVLTACGSRFEGPRPAPANVAICRGSLEAVLAAAHPELAQRVHAAALVRPNISEFSPHPLVQGLLAALLLLFERATFCRGMACGFLKCDSSFTASLQQQQRSSSTTGAPQQQQLLQEDVGALRQLDRALLAPYFPAETSVVLHNSALHFFLLARVVSLLPSSRNREEGAKVEVLDDLVSGGLYAILLHERRFAVFWRDVRLRYPVVYTLRHIISHIRSSSSSTGTGTGNEQEVGALFATLMGANEDLTSRMPTLCAILISGIEEQTQATLQAVITTSGIATLVASIDKVKKFATAIERQGAVTPDGSPPPPSDVIVGTQGGDDGTSDDDERARGLRGAAEGTRVFTSTDSATDLASSTALPTDLGVTPPPSGASPTMPSSPSSPRDAAPGSGEVREGGVRRAAGAAAAGARSSISIEGCNDALLWVTSLVRILADHAVIQEFVLERFPTIAFYLLRIDVPAVRQLAQQVLTSLLLYDCEDAATYKRRMSFFVRALWDAVDGAAHGADEEPLLLIFTSVRIALRHAADSANSFRFERRLQNVLCHPRICPDSLLRLAGKMHPRWPSIPPPHICDEVLSTVTALVRGNPQARRFLASSTSGGEALVDAALGAFGRVVNTCEVIDMLLGVVFEDSVDGGPPLVGGDGRDGGAGPARATAIIQNAAILAPLLRAFAHDPSATPLCPPPLLPRPSSSENLGPAADPPRPCRVQFATEVLQHLLRRIADALAATRQSVWEVCSTPDAFDALIDIVCGGPPSCSAGALRCLEQVATQHITVRQLKKVLFSVIQAVSRAGAPSCNDPAEDPEAKGGSSAAHALSSAILLLTNTVRSYSKRFHEPKHYLAFKARSGLSGLRLRLAHDVPEGAGITFALWLRSDGDAPGASCRGGDSLARARAGNSKRRRACIFSVRGPNAGRTCYELALVGSQLVVRSRDEKSVTGVTSEVELSGEVAPQVWTHIAVVHRPATMLNKAELRLYINGDEASHTTKPLYPRLSKCEILVGINAEDVATGTTSSAFYGQVCAFYLLRTAVNSHTVRMMFQLGCSNATCLMLRDTNNVPPSARPLIEGTVVNDVVVCIDPRLAEGGRLFNMAGVLASTAAGGSGGGSSPGGGVTGVVASAVGSVTSGSMSGAASGSYSSSWVEALEGTAVCETMSILDAICSIGPLQAVVLPLFTLLVSPLLPFDPQLMAAVVPLPAPERRREATAIDHNMQLMLRLFQAFASLPVVRSETRERGAFVLLSAFIAKRAAALGVHVPQRVGALCLTLGDYEEECCDAIQTLLLNPALWLHCCGDVQAEVFATLRELALTRSKPGMRAIVRKCGAGAFACGQIVRHYHSEDIEFHFLVRQRIFALLDTLVVEPFAQEDAISIVSLAMFAGVCNDSVALELLQAIRHLALTRPGAPTALGSDASSSGARAAVATSAAGVKRFVELLGRAEYVAVIVPLLGHRQERIRIEASRHLSLLLAHSKLTQQLLNPTLGADRIARSGVGPTRELHSIANVDVDVVAEKLKAFPFTLESYFGLREGLIGTANVGLPGEVGGGGGGGSSPSGWKSSTSGFPTSVAATGAAPVLEAAGGGGSSISSVPCTPTESHSPPLCTPTLTPKQSFISSRNRTRLPPPPPAPLKSGDAVIAFANVLRPILMLARDSEAAVRRTVLADCNALVATSPAAWREIVAVGLWQVYVCDVMLADGGVEPLTSPSDPPLVAPEAPREHGMSSALQEGTLLLATVLGNAIGNSSEALAELHLVMAYLDTVRNDRRTREVAHQLLAKLVEVMCQRFSQQQRNFGEGSAPTALEVKHVRGLLALVEDELFYCRTVRAATDQRKRARSVAPANVEGSDSFTAGFVNVEHTHYVENDEIFLIGAQSTDMADGAPTTAHEAPPTWAHFELALGAMRLICSSVAFVNDTGGDSSGAGDTHSGEREAPPPLEEATTGGGGGGTATAGVHDPASVVREGGMCRIFTRLCRVALHYSPSSAASEQTVKLAKIFIELLARQPPSSFFQRRRTTRISAGLRTALRLFAILHDTLEHSNQQVTAATDSNASQGATGAAGESAPAAATAAAGGGGGAGSASPLHGHRKFVSRQNLICMKLCVTSHLEEMEERKMMLRAATSDAAKMQKLAAATSAASIQRGGPHEIRAQHLRAASAAAWLQDPTQQDVDDFLAYIAPKDEYAKFLAQCRRNLEHQADVECGIVDEIVMCRARMLKKIHTAVTEQCVQRQELVDSIDDYIHEFHQRRQDLYLLDFMATEPALSSTVLSKYWQRFLARCHGTIWYADEARRSGEALRFTRLARAEQRRLLQSKLLPDPHGTRHEGRTPHHVAASGGATPTAAGGSATAVKTVKAGEYDVGGATPDDDDDDDDDEEEEEQLNNGDEEARPSGRAVGEPEESRASGGSGEGAAIPDVPPNAGIDGGDRAADPAQPTPPQPLRHRCSSRLAREGSSGTTSGAESADAAVVPSATLAAASDEALPGVSASSSEQQPIQSQARAAAAPSPPPPQQPPQQPPQHMQPLVPRAAMAAVKLKLPCEMVHALQCWSAELLIAGNFMVVQLDETCTAYNQRVADNALCYTAKPQSQSWPVREISEVAPGRRYRMLRTAIEFRFRDGTSALISLADKAGMQQVLSALKQCSPLLRRYVVLSDQPRKELVKQGLTARWRRRELSNMDYLLGLNFLAGRTLNDLTQFPVFPWVVADYTSDELDLQDAATFRDLAVPMGILGSPGRREEVEARYAEMEAFGDEPFHYFTHYSSAAVPLHFLVRIEPYTSGQLLLQGGRFDHADRMFHSVASTWRGVTSNIQDVKELIPHFYFFPEMFVNGNKVEFGQKQDGEAMNDVVLPPWANGSPYRFVQLLREALESEHVSANLHHWIDLIFGVKQHGPKAAAACNLFHPHTYEPATPPSSMDVETRREVINSLDNIGQTPIQLFTRPHPERRPEARVHPLRGPGSALGVRRENLRWAFPSIATMQLTAFDRLVVVGCDGAAVVFRCAAAPVLLLAGADGTPMSTRNRLDDMITRFRTHAFSIDLASDFESRMPPLPAGLIPASSPPPLASARTTVFGASCGVDDEDADGTVTTTGAADAAAASGVLMPPAPSGSTSAVAILAFSSTEIFTVHAGVFDGSCIVRNMMSRRDEKRLTAHSSKVVLLATTSDSSHMVSGSRDTSFLVWRFDVSRGVFRARVMFGVYGHEEEPTCAAICNQLDVVVTAAQHACFVHGLRSGTLERRLEHPAGRTIDHLLIQSTAYIPTILMASRADCCVHQFSVNGSMLRSVELGARLVHWAATADPLYVMFALAPASHSGGGSGTGGERAIPGAEAGADAARHPLQFRAAFDLALVQRVDLRHVQAVTAGAGDAAVGADEAHTAGPTTAAASPTPAARLNAPSSPTAGGAAVPPSPATLRGPELPPIALTCVNSHPSNIQVMACGDAEGGLWLVGTREV